LIVSRALPVLVAFSLLLAAPVRPMADASAADQDAARAAVESGAILPLETILARLKGRLPGEIVKVKLERHREAWTYEFRVIDPQGHWREIVVDAATGGVIGSGED
jgi:uncharacterized membrane protein YkoI